MQAGDPRLVSHGIVLSLVPDDARYGAEIWRASDSSAPGVAPATSQYGALIALAIPAGGQYYLDSLPLDGYQRYYQARQVSLTNSQDAGPFTASTPGTKPMGISQSVLGSLTQPSVYPLNRSQPFNDANYALSAANTAGNQFAADVYLPSTQKIHVGAAAASSYLTKSMDLDYGVFVARAATTLTLNNGWLNFTSSGGQTIAAPLGVIPNGAMIQSATSLSALVSLATTQEQDSVQITLKARLSTDPSNVDIIKGGLLQPPGTSTVGVWTEVYSAPGTTTMMTIGQSSYGSYELEYKITSTSPTNSKLARGRIQYLVPSYDIGR